MFVAASSDCFPELDLESAVSRLSDLEYTRFEIAVHERGRQLKPSELVGDLDAGIEKCRAGHRLTPVAIDVGIDATGDAYYEQFAAVCRLAKALKVVTVCVPASELGTPFNAEVERLRELVAIGVNDGVVVALKTQIGCVSQDPSTAKVFCDNVKGLGIALDPSCYHYGSQAGVDFDSLIPYTRHVILRDTNEQTFQARVGQGNIEYGRLITQLGQAKYNRALSVHIQPAEEVEHHAELRKIRLLLDSLL